ncbi:Bug family tripartite tricarboxylate transporter substrate binding protein [Verticiella sediminum]|uniref:Bug family tripartite tricarboxylate transporter substrate binding protein n=1 Tax=Verticiella sediminum TaxID=1247510 RepID=UPI001478451A|nr:tripartite tricarboxylate transporter substrate binding protein [Verticiella sediminum]
MATRILRRLPGGWQALSFVSVLATALALPTATAQGFPLPGKPVRIVVPAPPGGPGDTVARAVAAELTTQLPGHPIVVDNKPGGASLLAANDVLRAAPDGHTLLLALNTTHTQVPHMFGKPPFDPFKDFTPIAQVYEAQSVLVAHPSLAADDLKQAVELSRQDPIPAGSASPGTNSHLYLEMMNHEYGARFEHIPYKGSADALRDLLGGITRLQFDSPSSSLPHIRAGRLKALAVTGAQRLPQLPDVASAAEQGYPALAIGAWMGFFGPAGMAAEDVTRLNREIVQALQSPRIAAQFEPLGLRITGTSPERFAEVVRADHAQWGAIIQQLGLRLDQ